MIESVTAAAKLKVIIAVLSLLILGSVYSASEETVISQTMELKDPYVTDIQARADLVENAVMEAVNQQGKQSPLVYKQTCESAMSTIRGERLDTGYNYNTLDTSQKELVNEYRNYLQEAANVIVICASGQNPDLAKMNELKAKLN